MPGPGVGVASHPKGIQHDLRRRALRCALLHGYVD
jgi:hypothetical protein